MNKLKIMVGVIAAMEEELTQLLDIMDDVSVESVGHIRFYLGVISGRTVAVTQCGIGKVNAAMGATLLVERYKPQIIINTGIAGAAKEKINIGDMILSTSVGHHDADVTAFNYKIGQIPEMPEEYLANEELVKSAHKVACDITEHSVHCGKILSGDSFIHTKDQATLINSNFKDVLALEMEGAAIAQVAYQFSLPFLLIRSISDNVYADDNCTAYTLNKEESANKSVDVLVGVLNKLRRNDYAKSC